MPHRTKLVVAWAKFFRSSIRNLVDADFQFVVTRNELKEVLSKWNARPALKARQKLARGEARSEASA